MLRPSGVWDGALTEVEFGGHYTMRSGDNNFKSPLYCALTADCASERCFNQSIFDAVPTIKTHWLTFLRHPVYADSEHQNTNTVHNNNMYDN